MTDDKPGSVALVLGGGGVAGIAWMTGVLHGLQQAGVEVAGFERVIGTSAGAAVAAQLHSGLPLAQLFQRQVDPAQQVAELVPTVSKFRLLLRLLPALLARKDPQRFRQRVGAAALKASSVDPAARYRVIEQRLPAREWPAVQLDIVVVDAASGDMVVFNRDAGVSLTDAVAASCAVPGIWPPVRINDTDYIDGGLRSATNADLAAGAASVVVLAPMGYQSFLNTGSHLREEVAGLEATGTRVLVVVPDQQAKQAIGANPLDPATRAPAAQAGQQQAAVIAGEVARFLGAQAQ